MEKEVKKEEVQTENVENQVENQPENQVETQPEGTTEEEPKPQVIDLSGFNKFDAAFMMGMVMFINFPLMAVEKTEYSNMTWKELTAYFEDADIFFGLDDTERVKLYNAVKDKVLKDEFGFHAFPVALNKNESIENALGVTRINEGFITITEKEEESFVDMYSDYRNLYNDRRFAGLKTLNTI